MDKKVTVTRWCNNPAESSALLEKYVTTDQNEIAAYRATHPWTSPCIWDADADELAAEITKLGGAAFTTVCGAIARSGSV